ncbi:MAG TPA: nucleotidyltransferase family protein [Candidatus Binatia bacterium]|jgi:molybdenum cofactor cytidylyltransferase|nr:nucleotidyltransferase family protein [Candidatus Binatia bacterium]
MTNDASDDRVALVVLAAGGSSRMGQPKQLLPYRGTSLLRHAATEAVASRCRPVTVVLGHAAERLAPEIADLPVRTVVNRVWTTGMASSIRTGIETVLDVDPGAEAAVLMLCDQPLVSAPLLDALVNTWRSTGRSIVASDYGGGLGVPAIFARCWFDDLRCLRGDVGAKAMLRTHAAHVALVPFPGGAIDVDSPADHARLATMARIGARQQYTGL